MIVISLRGDFNTSLLTRLCKNHWDGSWFPCSRSLDCLTVALHESCRVLSCCSSVSVSFTHPVMWAALTNRILLRGGRFVAELCWRDAGWSSVVGAFWAYSLPAGRVGLRFTAVLNGPWESSVMDSSEPQHTLALCVGDLGTFSLTQCHTHLHTHTFGDTNVSFSSLLVISLWLTRPPL